MRSLARAGLVAGTLFALGPPPGGAHPGTGIVMDRAGSVFFTDLSRIWKLEPGGRLSVAVPETHTHELYVDGEGNLFGEHAWYEPGENRFWTRAWKRAPGGALTEVLPATEGFPGFVSAAVDAAKNRYFADVNNNLRETSRVLRRASDGALTTLAGGAWGQRDGAGPQARFSSIGGVTLGADGHLYVTDGASVRRIGLDGRVKTLAREGLLSKPRLAVSGGNSNHLMGIAADRKGRVFLAHFARRSVLEVAPDGRVTRVMRERWPWSPTGVALTGRGDLLVLEYPSPPMPGKSRVRVVRVTPGGRATVLAMTSR
jgi:hypothetical protein